MASKRTLNLTPPSKGGRRSLIDRIMDDLGEADRDAVSVALQDRFKWSNRDLANALRANGIEISPSTIGNWRRDNGI